ncbi:MAG: bifunctional tetrahydrofolate synthase/dihydrofolate synthase [Legionellales bacterium]
MLNKPWAEWDLTQWLDVLANTNQQEIQLGLTRILSVALKLKLQIQSCKVITVGGTNGKGSTVSALEMIYHTAGYKVGAYTSPHLLSFNERIRVNLVPISDDALCLAFGIVEEARESIVLTYFEMTTLAALLYFKQQNLDVIILEVGLGGRLDATNIVDADLSIITTIDFDHQDFLGDTLDAIGFEKAGILRKDKPFIYADSNPPSSIIDVVKKLNTPHYFYGIDYSIVTHLEDWELHYLDQHLIHLPIPKIQIKSAAAAIMASILLQHDLPVSSKHLDCALEAVFIPARLQLLQRGDISILYDVSHNPQSARLLADRLRTLKNSTKIHAVFSALKDKDIIGLINPLKDYVDCWYPAQIDPLSCARAAEADFLLAKLREAEIFVEICYNSPIIAFEAAFKQAMAGDIIVVYGSFFTVSDVMSSCMQKDACTFFQKEIL